MPSLPQLPYFAHGSTTGATSLCLLRSLPGGETIRCPKSARAECTIYANSLPLFPSLSLKSIFFFTLQIRYFIDPRLRAFMRHLCLPLTLSLVLSSPSPTQGESGPPPSGWEASPLPLPTESPGKAGSAPLHLHPPLPSPPSFSFPHPQKP